MYTRGFMSQLGPNSLFEQLTEAAFDALCPKDHFIQQVMSAAKTKDVVSLKELSKQRYLLTEDDSKKNALVSLFLEDDQAAASFLANFLKMDHTQLAEYAAQAGKKSIVEFYLNAIEPQKRNYVRLAAKAACGGHLDLAEYFLGNNHSGIHWVIEEAAYAGHKTIVEHFFVKLPLHEQNYDFIARCADQGNNVTLAEYFRQKQKSLSEAMLFKKPSPILRKTTQKMPPPFFNKPDPIEPPILSPQPIPVTFSSQPFWLGTQPPLLYQFGLPSLHQAIPELGSDHAPNAQTRPELF